MTTASLLPSKIIRLSYIRLISCALAVMVSLWSSFSLSADFKCSDGSDPITPSTSQGLCAINRCGICTPSGQNWANPKAEVIYQVSPYLTFGVPTDPVRKTIRPGTCTWISGVRFCVRAAKPGDPGNNTKRPQICAYEDPCDGMDPPDGNCAANSNISPFQFRTSNSEAKSLAKAAEEGAMYGGSASAVLALLGPFGLVGAGASVGISVMIAGIQGTFNQVVTTNIGCIDREIGPLPPKWSNNAWFNNSMPMPTFVEEVGSEKISGDPDSVFESPRIKVKTCKDPGTSQILSCDVATSVENTNVRLILNPNSTNLYRDCQLIRGVDEYSYDRTFCATITTDEPDKIKLSMIVDGTETDVEPPIGSFITRPGYIPKPTLSEAAGSTSSAIKVNVTLRGQSITLEEATETNPNAVSTRTLHQVPFSLIRPCVTTPEPGTACNDYQNIVCLEGYDTAPFTAVTTSTDTPVTGTPNVSRPKNTAFLNSAASKEKGAYLSESYKNDLQIYDGTTTLASTQSVRPITPLEAGLCIFTPPDTGQRIFSTPGTYTYTVPVNCTKIDVQVWGGGGAGYVAGSGDGDAAGAGGGYVKDTINVTAGNTMDITVGAGGINEKNGGAASTATILSKTYTANGGAGGKKNGGSAGGTGICPSGTTTCVAVNGGQGLNSHGNLKDGGTTACNTAINGTPTCNNDTLYAQPASICTSVNDNVHAGKAQPGGGGCSDDGNGWGSGGGGEVIVQCTVGMN